MQYAAVPDADAFAFYRFYPWLTMPTGAWTVELTGLKR